MYRTPKVRSTSSALCRAAVSGEHPPARRRLPDPSQRDNAQAELCGDAPLGSMPRTETAVAASWRSRSWPSARRDGGASGPLSCRHSGRAVCAGHSRKAIVRAPAAGRSRLVRCAGVASVRADARNGRETRSPVPWRIASRVRLARLRYDRSVRRSGETRGTGARSRKYPDPQAVPSGEEGGASRSSSCWARPPSTTRPTCS